MPVYEVTTEDGGVYEITTDEAPQQEASAPAPAGAIGRAGGRFVENTVGAASKLLTTDPRETAKGMFQATSDAVGRTRQAFSDAASQPTPMGQVGGFFRAIPPALGMVPVVGPALEQFAGDVQQGNIPEAVGDAAAMYAPTKIPAVARGVGRVGEAAVRRGKGALQGAMEVPMSRSGTAGTLGFLSGSLFGEGPTGAVVGGAIPTAIAAAKGALKAKPEVAPIPMKMSPSTLDAAATIPTSLAATPVPEAGATMLGRSGTVPITEPLPPIPMRVPSTLDPTAMRPATPVQGPLPSMEAAFLGRSGTGPIETPPIPMRIPPSTADASALRTTPMAPTTVPSMESTMLGTSGTTMRPDVGSPARIRDPQVTIPAQAAETIVEGADVAKTYQPKQRHKSPATVEREMKKYDQPTGVSMTAVDRLKENPQAMKAAMKLRREMEGKGRRK